MIDKLKKGKRSPKKELLDSEKLFNCLDLFKCRNNREINNGSL